MPHSPVLIRRAAPADANAVAVLAEGLAQSFAFSRSAAGSVTPMTTWTSDELTRIGNADELQIAPKGRDGRLRDPVTIWVVRNGDDLYCGGRSGRGQI